MVRSWSKEEQVAKWGSVLVDVGGRRFPLPEDSVDVIISNCVINLPPDKTRAFHESHRVLVPGGRFAVTDIVTMRPFTTDEKADVAEWTGCISGAFSREEFVNGLRDAGFKDVEVQITHEVGPDIVSAIVRATA
jgi:arsenite methyltransferase